jgi:hypothetical protein
MEVESPVELALTIGIILLVFLAFFVALFLLKRWSEKNEPMRGDFGDRFRLWKRPDREE